MPNLKQSKGGDYYKINYTLVEAKSPCMRWTATKRFKYKDTPKKVKKDKTDQVSPVKVEKSVFVNFNRMKGRPDFITLQPRGNPHTKRFENMNAFPAPFSRSK